MEWHATELAVSAVALLLGGLVKGTFGIGLPMVATSLMAFFVDVPTAVVLMTAPMLSSNLWQAYRDGDIRSLRRFWTFLVAIIPGTWISTKLLFEIDRTVLIYIMGSSLVLFSGLQLTRFRLKVTSEQERWVTPLVGLAAGLVGGLTTFYGAVVALYLLMLDIKRDEFIGVIGILYFICTVVLLGFLGLHGAVDTKTAMISVGICVPMFFGLAVGQRIRNYIAPEAFFTSISVFLVLIGLALMARNLF